MFLALKYFNPAIFFKGIIAKTHIELNQLSFLQNSIQIGQ